MWRRVKSFHFYVDKPVSKDSQQRLREEFTFLSATDCPLELQALVTRKITQYHRYHELYPKLFSCKSLSECSSVANALILAYLDNNKIYQELKHYEQYHKVLGRHPIFNEFVAHKKLRTLSIKDLIRREQQVLNNIWRVKNEMDKKTKPELDDKRRDRLRQYESELIEIKRLLDE